MNKEAHPFYSSSDQKRYINPLLESILRKYNKNKTTIIGIQGGQGTGKTTLARFLQEKLRKKGYVVESFSIDDFYTSYKERKRLAQHYPNNPYYQIPRGMPGTHRVKELLHTLQNINEGRPFTIPAFDKSLHQGAGDVIGERKVTKRVDFVFFEGWCVGLPAISEKELKRICTKNTIFLPSGYKIMLQFLKKYRSLWKYVDYIIMLKPQHSELHLKWRRQQEQELQQQKGNGMSQKQMEQFVSPFLPLTYAGYEKIKANAALTIDRRHEFVELN